MFQVIDLSVPIDEDAFVVTEESGYTDPPIRFERWATIEEKGYAITALHMSGHVGTHLDVSSHYVPTGRTVTDIEASTFVGYAVVLDFVGKGRMSESALAQYGPRVKGRDDVIVVIRNTKEDSLTDDGRRLLAAWKPKLIVAGQGWDVDIRYEDSDFFHRADIPMIMRPDPEAMTLVQDDDLIVGMPILLRGREASPVRLVAIRGLSERGAGYEKERRSEASHGRRRAWWPW